MPCFLFTGDSTYRLAAEVRRWKREFIEKYSAEEFYDITDLRHRSLADLLDIIAPMPCFSPKRLVLFRGLPFIEKDEMEVLIQQCHPSTVVAFIESKLDKRLGRSKVVLEQCSIKTFPLPTPQELVSFAQDLATTHGSSLSLSVARTLIDTVGTDEWIIASEVEKLSVAAGANIEQSHLDQLCLPGGQTVTWALTDSISRGKTRQGLRILHQLWERGEEPYGTYSILLHFIRQLILVTVATHDGLPPAAIAKATGVHPQGVRSMQPFASKLTLSECHSLLEEVAQIDRGLKSGVYIVKADYTTEIEILTESLILRMSHLAQS